MRRNQKRKSFAVFGLGEFGRSIALELTEAGADVMVLDKNEDVVSEMADYVTLSMQLDATEARSYRSLGLSNLDGVIVAMTSCLDACIMAILSAKDAGVPFVLAKAKDSTQALIFQKVGADKTVTPEHDGGVRAARNIVSGNFLDFIELSKTVCMVEMPVKNEWEGKSLRQLSLRQRYNINVVAIRMGEEISTDIDPDDKLNENETLLIITDEKYLDNLSN